MDGWAQIKSLPGEIWILNIANVVNRAGSMVFIFLGLYLTKHLGHPTSVAGLLLGAVGFTSLVVTPLGGWLSDKLGPKSILVWSLILTGGLFLVFPFVGNNLPLIFGLTILVSLIGEVFGPANLMYCTSSVPTELKRASIALNRLSHNLGMSVGPMLGGFLAAYSFDWLFWVDGATSIIAGVLLLFLLKEKFYEGEEQPSYFKNLLLQLKDPTLVYFLLAGLPLLIAWYQFNTILPIVLSKDWGVTEAQYGALFTINTILIVLLEVPLTLRIARWPASRALVTSALFFCAGFGCLLLNAGYTGVIVMVVLITVGEMILAPGGTAYISDISPKGREGSYMGTFSASYSLGYFLAPLIGTFLYERGGGKVLWSAAVVVCFLTAVLFSRVRPAK